MDKYYCFVSGKEIPFERVEFLKESGLAEHMWTCVEHSMTRPKKGVYHGPDNEEFMIVDKVYDDSVREVFRASEEETDELAVDVE